LIAVRTHIGFGSPHKQDTAAAHGEPLGVEEVRLTKEGMGWPVEPAFHVPAEALEHFRKAVARGESAQFEWESRFKAFAQEFPGLAAEFSGVIARQLPKDWDADLPHLVLQTVRWQLALHRERRLRCWAVVCPR